MVCMSATSARGGQPQLATISSEETVPRFEGSRKRFQGSNRVPLYKPPAPKKGTLLITTYLNLLRTSSPKKGTLFNRHASCVIEIWMGSAHTNWRAIQITNPLLPVRAAPSEHMNSGLLKKTGRRWAVDVPPAPAAGEEVEFSDGLAAILADMAES